MTHSGCCFGWLVFRVSPPRKTSQPVTNSTDNAAKPISNQNHQLLVTAVAAAAVVPAERRLAGLGSGLGGEDGVEAPWFKAVPAGSRRVAEQHKCHELDS